MTGLEHHNLGTGAGFPARFAMGGGQVSQGLIGRVARALPAIFAATMMCAAAFLAATSTADACSIAAPTCVSAINGLESERVDLGLESQNASIFVERSVDWDLARLFLVDCRTRRGLVADIPDGADFQTPVVARSIDYLIEAASSDRTYSLNEIREHLRGQGLSARINRLPDGHCGCTLPVPDLMCPEDSSG